jgi:hypothetical protein
MNKNFSEKFSAEMEIREIGSWLRVRPSDLGQVVDGASALAVIGRPDEQKTVSQLVHLNHDLRRKESCHF